MPPRLPRWLLSLAAAIAVLCVLAARTTTSAQQLGEVGAAIPTNVLVNNPSADTTAQDTQSETSLVLGANGSIIVGFNDSGSLMPGGTHFMGYARSTDGGASFTDLGALPLSANGEGGNPVLARINATGRILFASLAFNTPVRIQVFPSTDDGVSFGPPVNGMPGFLATDTLDKPWMTVDNFPGTPASGSGNVYVVARNFNGGSGGRPNGIFLTRSSDGGSTFTPVAGLQLTADPNPGHGAWVEVAPDHSVWVFYHSLPGPAIRMRRSANAGVSFGAETTVATLLSLGGNGDLALNGGFRTNSFPHAAINPVSGHAYVVYNDPTQVSGGDRGNIMFKLSDNSGASWAGPTKLNDDATTRDQFQPAIAVTPDGKWIFVSWYDRRNSATNTAIEYWGVIGSISGSTVTWGANFQISSASFPSVRNQDPALNSLYMGSYDTAAADNTWFYVTWGDNRLSNSFHANQPDVRFARIPVAFTAFNKSSPINGAGNLPPTVPLSWTASPSATNYQYCVDTSNNNVCDTSWVNVGVTTSTAIGNLAPSTTYFWQVRSITPTGTTEANEGVWWTFTTQFFRAARLIQPTPESRLPGQAVPFAWDQGVNVVQYSLFIGSSPGAGDIYMQNQVGFYRFIGNIPVDARFIYVRLFSRIGNAWVFTDYRFVAASAASSTFEFGIQPVPGDFDGDDVADLATWWGGPGVWNIVFSTSGWSATQMLQLSWGRADLGDRPVMGDFDGDGKADPAVWRAGSGLWLALLSSTNYATYLQIPWGRADLGDVPVPADFDGDGKTDPAVWRSGTGFWYALKSQTNYSQYIGVSWGRADLTDRPVVGDYDGDNRADPAVWRALTGEWLALRSSTNFSNYLAISWGREDQTDQPVPADYDGDGRTDIAVWRRATGVWHILTSSTNYAEAPAVHHGNAALGDRPVPDQFLGNDLKDDLIVWRGSTGVWQVTGSPGAPPLEGSSEATLKGAAVRPGSPPPR